MFETMGKTRVPLSQTDTEAGILDKHWMKSNFPQASNLIHRGQGYKDGAEDVRLFRRAIFENKVMYLLKVLTYCGLPSSEAVTVSRIQPGIAKLAKSRVKDQSVAVQKMTVRRRRFLPLPKA